MAVLTSQRISTTGITPSFAAAAGGGDSFSNTGNEYVEFKNTNAAARNVTFVAQGKCSHGVLHDLIVNIPANTGNIKVGPFRDLARWNDANGRVQMTYDAVTNLTAGVFAE